MKKIIIILGVFSIVLSAQLYKEVKPESNNLGVKLVRVLEIREGDNAVIVDLLNADSSIAFGNTFFRLDKLPFELTRFDVYKIAGLDSTEIADIESKDSGNSLMVGITIFTLATLEGLRRWRAKRKALKEAKVG